MRLGFLEVRLIILAMILWLAIGASAQPRVAPTLSNKVALVIGNGAYATRLANPVRDARAVADTLRQMGFEVIERRDLGRDAMLRAVIELEDKMTGNEAIAVFYYAGHGMQLDGQSVLIPVDAQTTGAMDVRVTGVALERVVRSMSRARPRASIVILDACRDNPFAMATPGGARGLAGLMGAAPSDMLLQYATAPGQVADDGDPMAPHSPFTSALLKILPARNVDVQEVFRRVRAEVIAGASRGGTRQEPWESSSLTRSVVLNLGPDDRKSSDASAAPLLPSRHGDGLSQQAGTQAGGLLLKLLAPATTEAQRARTIMEFVSEGYAMRGLSPEEVIKAIDGLTGSRRMEAMKMLVQGVDELDSDQLLALAGSDTDRDSVLWMLSERLRPRSMGPEDLSRLLQGARFVSGYLPNLLKALREPLEPKQARALVMQRSELDATSKTQLLKSAGQGGVAGEALLLSLGTAADDAQREERTNRFLSGTGSGKITGSQALAAIDGMQEPRRSNALFRLSQSLKPIDVSEMLALVGTGQEQEQAVGLLSKHLRARSMEFADLTRILERVRFPSVFLARLLPALRTPLSTDEVQRIAGAGQPGPSEYQARLRVMSTSFSELRPQPVAR